jgi:poly-gamma-glutamate synthesis protein (capsule biosynthesis protein)
MKKGYLIVLIIFVVITLIYFCFSFSNKTEEAQIAIAGDVMLGRNINEAMLNKPAEYFWGDVIGKINEADLFLVNLECVLTDSEEKSEIVKSFYFKASPERAVKVLEAGGTDVVNLANNHVLDFKEKGMNDTLSSLDKAGIKHVGAGSLEEAGKIERIEVNGIKIGIIGVTDNRNEWKVEGDKQGINYYEINNESARKLGEKIREARDNFDLIILTIHWGPNLRTDPSEEFREFAKEMVASGVDIIHGHSSHMFQGVEVYKNKIIIYDSGEFLDDYGHNELKLYQSFLFLINIKDKKIANLEMLPVFIDGKVELAAGAEKAEIMDRMINLSAKFGTSLEKQETKLLLKLNS